MKTRVGRCTDGVVIGEVSEGEVGAVADSSGVGAEAEERAALWPPLTRDPRRAWRLEDEGSPVSSAMSFSERTRRTARSSSVTAGGIASVRDSIGWDQLAKADVSEYDAFECIRVEEKAV